MGLEHMRERRLRFEELVTRAEYRHLVVLRLRSPREAATVIHQLKARPA